MAAAKEVIGTSLAGFAALIAEVGGREALAGKSTAWLKYNSLLDASRTAACAAVVWLAARGHTDVSRRANHFMSHTYDDELLKVFDALTAWGARQPTGGSQLLPLRPS